MRIHNAVFAVGFIANNLLASRDVPFWPIWWSQTGLQEGTSGASRALFVTTNVATAATFLFTTLRHSTPTLLEEFLVTAGSGFFAGLALLNSNRPPIRTVHNVLAGLSGLCMVAYLVLVLYRRPRAHVPTWRTTGVIFFMLFVVETAIKKRLWVPPAIGQDVPLAVARWLRISSVMQWLQLALFGYITEYLHR